jgi:hypothetical protein
VEKVRSGIRNTVIELDWLKKKVPNMLIEPDWPSMLVDRGEKITSFKLTKYDFVDAYLDTRYCCFY